MATAVAKRDQQLLDAKRALKTRLDKMADAIAAAVPKHIEPDSMQRFLFNAINANPSIALECTTASIADCLIRAASRGLEISDGMLGDCYLVPFKNKKEGTTEATLIVGYKGIKKLVRNSGQGLVVMDHVREGDTFTQQGPMVPPLHVKSEDPKRNEKPLTHAYAVMQFQSGLCVVHVMTIAEILAHRRQYVQASNYRSKDKAWHEENVAFPRMCEKTCVRQLASKGDLPMSADDRTLLATVTMPQQNYQAPQPSVQPAAQPQIEQQDSTQVDAESTQVEEFEVDENELAAAVRECTTPKQCDDAEKDLRSQFKASAQLIHDAFEARREQITNQPKGNPATEAEPPC